MLAVSFALMGARLDEVHLDDDGPAPDAPAPVERRRRWPWVTAAVVVVVGLVGAQRVVDARHAAALARFDDVPGVVHPLTADPHPAWTLPADRRQVVRAGDVLVHAEVRDGGRLTVEGLDSATGHVEWSHKLTPPAGDGTTDPSDARLRCRSLRASPALADRVACVAAVTGVQVPAATDPPALVEVLDAHTGASLDRWQAAATLWNVTGDQIVTAVPADHGSERTWTITARTPDRGTTWTRTVDWTVETNSLGSTAHWSLQADADRVLLSADGHGALLGADGGLTRRLDGDAGTGWQLGRPGVLVTGEITPQDSTSELDTSVVEPTLDAPGVPPRRVLPLAVDDGSAPGVAFGRASDGGVAAYDVRIGAELWHAGSVGQPQVLLGGRLYTATGYRLVALDARTGHERWTRTLDGDEPFQFTDGRNLYVQGSDGVLHAFAVDDGAPGRVFRAAGVPSDVPSHRLSEWNGLLIADSLSGQTTVFD